jgi:hypothetical protein
MRKIYSNSLPVPLFLHETGTMLLAIREITPIIHIKQLISYLKSGMFKWSIEQWLVAIN